MRFIVGLTLAVLGLFHTEAFAASFTESVFATGTSLNATQPNSVAYGNGSVWVTYANNAPTRNYSGAGAIVQYDMAGAVQNTYSLAGSLGGLKYDANTGQFWVLQGQDAYSQLSIINPASKTISSYSIQGPSDYDAGTHGFDDVAFIGSKAFLSETKPFDPTFASEIIHQLNNPMPSGPVTLTTTLNLGTLLAKDPRQLNSTPDGGLILTGSTDRALTFVTDPGQPDQIAHSLKLIAASGTALGSPGDALYAGATSGTFFLTDSATNTVYSVAASGLAPNTLFIDAGTEFGTVDPDSGVVTPLFFGSDLTGMTFVPEAAPVPEPSTFALIAAALVLASSAVLGRRRHCQKSTLLD